MLVFLNSLVAKVINIFFGHLPELVQVNGFTSLLSGHLGMRKLIKLLIVDQVILNLYSLLVGLKNIFRMSEEVRRNFSRIQRP